jgi:hypothetical protein
MAVMNQTILNVIHLVIHPEEGTNISPETLVSNQESRRVITQKPLYKVTTTAKAFKHTQITNSYLYIPVQLAGINIAQLIKSMEHV